MVMLRWLRQLAFRARRANNDWLLDAAAFERAAMCERMRVDRNGSVLSILLMSIEDENAELNRLHDITRFLEGRLRLTDTAGMLRDGRLGILLPDTPGHGAWKVAQDIGDSFSGSEPGDSSRRLLKFEVLRYPEGDQESALSGAGADVEAPVEAPAEVRFQTEQVESVFTMAMPWWKRATDVFVGSLGLAVAAPVLVVCAGAVAFTSPGGAFFAQQREGAGGRRFKIYKIRTMYADAEDRKKDLHNHNEQDGPAFKMKSDPRVTPVGRVLRALSIDELPQFLNVVRGEMSLVGPRPLPVEESQQCRPWQRQRLSVTPGITCTWQVRGRNIVPFDEWVRMDLRYIRRRSPWGDLKLMMQTGPSLLFSKGPR